MCDYCSQQKNNIISLQIGRTGKYKKNIKGCSFMIDRFDNIIDSDSCYSYIEAEKEIRSTTYEKITQRLCETDFTVSPVGFLNVTLSFGDELYNAQEKGKKVYIVEDNFKIKYCPFCGRKLNV